MQQAPGSAGLHDDMESVALTQLQQLGPPFASINELEKRILGDEYRLLESLQDSTAGQHPFVGTTFDVDTDETQFRTTLAALLQDDTMEVASSETGQMYSSALDTPLDSGMQVPSFATGPELQGVPTAASISPAAAAAAGAGVSGAVGPALPSWLTWSARKPAAGAGGGSGGSGGILPGAAALSPPLDGPSGAAGVPPGLRGAPVVPGAGAGSPSPAAMSPAPVRGELVSLPLVESVRLSEVVRSSACGIGPALCKPAFCPDGSGRFVCGTEDQDPARRTRNLLLLAALDSGSRLVRESVTSYPVVEHLRDLHWYDAEHVVFALNDKIGLLRVGADNEIVESVVFPSFHKDTIRELAVAPFQPGLIISGGFDGNVFVTDIERLVTDIRRQQRRSENSLYPCGDVVGSVAWHPTQARVASCTTDGGILHIFDTRTELRSPALMFDAHRSELYTHAYVSDVMVALGFGSGLLQLVDWRMRRALALYRDPLLRAVGDIRVGGNGTAAVFGMSCVTVYESLQPSAAVTRGYGGAAAGDAQYRCNGNFRPGTGLLAVTDSLGCLQIYDAGATLDPA